MELNVEYFEQLIRKRGWSVRQFAQKSGLSHTTVSRIISGQRGAGTRAITGIRKAFPNEPLDKLFYF